jgi:hypothetical protein
MTIDEMEQGRLYTIRYRVSDTVQEFPGCRFEGIALAWYAETDPDNAEVRGAVVHRADTTPRLAYFSERRIVDIQPD